MICSIPLTEQEIAIAEAYAKQKSVSLSDAFKQALFEAIETESDVRTAQEAYSEYVANGANSRPIDCLWKECEL